MFGERQDPTGDYAAVIPKWIAAMINQKDVFINGDGKTSRDFCYVDNVIQANILAALTDDKTSINQVYNIALGSKTSLNELFVLIKSLLSELKIYYLLEPKYQEFRKGDVRHSLADIKKAKTLLGYSPFYNIDLGLRKCIGWYIDNLKTDKLQLKNLKMDILATGIKTLKMLQGIYLEKAQLKISLLN